MQKHEGILQMSQQHNHPNKYDCADIEQLAQRYVDNQLNKQERGLFEEHLEYCLPCDKKIQFEFKLKEIVRKKAKKETPAEFSSSKIKDFLKNLD